MNGSTLTLEEILKHVDEKVGDVVDNKIGSFLWKIVGGLVVAALGVAVAWGSLYTRVDKTEQDVMKLEQTAAVFLSRDQVEDILGGRDQRLSNIEASIMRIEKKLDTLKK